MPYLRHDSVFTTARKMKTRSRSKNLDKIFVFDTETTGLPPRGADPMQYQLWDGCRIVQIAWHIYSQDGGLEEKACYYVKPTFQIPARATEIHGITQEMAENEGIPLWKMVKIVSEKLTGVSHIVAHNLEFDLKVLMAEMVRIGDLEGCAQLERKQRVCTMRLNTLPGQRWPKLSDLYRRVFCREPEGHLHHADTDVQLCAEIYFATLRE